MKNYKSSLTLARAAMTLAGAPTRRAAMMLALALLTATTAWAQDAITGLTYNSTGGYYEISDAQDLVDLANYVNSGNNASGKTFKQTQDIDMSSTGNFEPIGSQPNNYNPTPFNGTYDGQGHAIIGLTVNTTSPYAGLFGLFQGGSVRNVTMVNPNVTSNYYSYGGKYAGGIVGSIKPGTIENCNVINPTLNPNSASKGAICGAIGNIYCVVTDCYYYTTTNYDAVGWTGFELAYSDSRTYTLTLADGITTSTVPAFSYGGTGYYASGTTITLPAAPIGWVYYTVNGSPIDGNTFDISADASVTVNKHISSLLGYDDDPLVDGSAEHPYIISTAEGWNLFCDCLNDNDTYNRFSGKTVRLGADITVSRMAGSSGHEFTGTFDGGGKTLTVNYANTGNNTMTAPFSYVDGATIQNLIVGGTISGTAYRAAGIIGETVNATSHITNCVSSVDISSDRYTGGFSIGGNVEIEGCVFNGKINGTARSGGFIGYSNSAQVIKNSLFAPQNGSSISGGTFYYNGGVDVVPINSYYTQALGTAQGKACHSVTAGENVTIDAIALTGTATQYTVSGIVAYSGGGLKRGETLYYGSGDQLSLTLSNTGAPQGYQYGYTASAGTLAGTILTMPDEDVTISVNTAALAPIDWATVNQGTSAAPYMIYNKDQLLLLAHRVNGTNGETANDYEGKYFKLGADITFDHPDNETDDYDENYEAIGGYHSGYHYFKGDFDGDGHTVSGIRINKTGSGIAYNRVGLFGQTGSANIHDVHLTDARIKGYYYVGGIVGYNSDKTTVSGCTVTDSYITATGGADYGTICGYNATGYYGGHLTNNYYHGCTVNGTAVTSGMGCGGSDLDDEDNNGARPAYAITLGDGVSTTALASAPENGFVYNGVSYYREGLALPLASTLGSEAPEGYTLSFSANGNALSGDTYTVNTTDGDVTITAAILSDGQQHEVSYVDADGTTQTAQAIALDGTETNLAAGWYFVGQPTVAFDHTITLDGDVNLILADGCTMNIGSSGSRINDNGIVRKSSGDQALTIYGQTAGTGTLSIYTDNGNNGIAAKAVTINGGNVTIDANGMWSTGIYAGVGNIIINSGNVNVTATGVNTWGLYANYNVNVNGGNVNATGGSSGIRTDNGDITLGYTNPTDYILSSGYETDGTAKVADGQALTDESGHIYTSTLTDEQLADIANQTLTPVNLYVINGNSDETVSFSEQIEHATVIYDRKFTSGVASTIVLPFDFDATALGGTLHTISSIDEKDGKWVAKASAAITEGTANTPYLFKPNSDIVSTTFKDVTIVLTEEKAITIGESNWQMKGVYQFKEWNADSPIDYGFAGAAQTTTEGDAISAGDFVRVGSGAKIRATRCYLTYADGISKASPILPDRITVIFPDATASVIEPQPADPSEDADPSGDITTPISEIAAQSGTKVWGYDGTIYIESQPYTPYTMIDLAGRTLQNGVTNSTREEVTLSRPASIVIVRIGGKTFKIFNR